MSRPRIQFVNLHDIVSTRNGVLVEDQSHYQYTGMRTLFLQLTLFVKYAVLHISHARRLPVVSQSVSL